ncbi:hypothetical protein [Streptomyces sp. NPDC018000]|uniref:hypothetical protein n=1 Tax=Streptomyces sp. NPDC018000 TaxID=3365028 RepID=UPI0037B99414
MAEREDPRGPEDRLYDVLLDAASETTSVRLKGGTEARFESDRAVISYSDVYGAPYVATARVAGGRPVLTHLAAGSPDPNAAALSPARLQRAAVVISEHLAEVYRVGWEQRGKQLAACVFRRLGDAGQGVAEEDCLHAAVVYSIALLFGQDPIPAVREHFGISESTARRRIRVARDDLHLLKPYSELVKGSIPDEADDIPWLDPDDPQFLAHITKLDEEMKLIFAPGLYSIIRSTMFFEMLMLVIDGDGEGQEASEEARAAARALFDAMTLP